MRMLLVRGMLTGLVAGLLALVFARIFGEPSVGAAIDFESAGQAAMGETPEPELVSRGVQSTIGLATGVVVYAVTFGGLFAVAFALTYGRNGRLSPRATAAVVALGGYLTTFVVPFLKYPANPPSVGNPDTINERTVTYFGLVALSIALAIAATAADRQRGAGGLPRRRAVELPHRLAGHPAGPLDHHGPGVRSAGPASPGARIAVDASGGRDGRPRPLTSRTVTA